MPKPPQTLRFRKDFLACARAHRWATPGMVVQGRPRHDGSTAVRVGYTCSKKVGNAVARNRAKRRLRAAAAELFDDAGLPGWDYVLIGRASATARRPFSLLQADLSEALSRIHQRGAAR